MKKPEREFIPDRNSLHVNTPLPVEAQQQSWTAVSFLRSPRGAISILLLNIYGSRSIFLDRVHFFWIAFNFKQFLNFFATFFPTLFSTFFLTFFSTFFFALFPDFFFRLFSRLFSQPLFYLMAHNRHGSGGEWCSPPSDQSIFSYGV